MIKVILLRHSITEGNLNKRYIGTTDESLCHEGLKLIEDCTHPNVDAVYSSPLKRCIQTAASVFSKNSIEVCDDLRECDFGDFENKNYLELSENEYYQSWIKSGGKLPFPNGEDIEKFKNRSVRAFESCVRNAIEKNIKSIAIVAHGGTIMSVMERLAEPKRSYYEWHVENMCGYTVMVKIDNKKMHLIGIEPTTLGFGGQCSIR